jgi:hypothetical protein
VIAVGEIVFRVEADLTTLREHYAGVEDRTPDAAIAAAGSAMQEDRILDFAETVDAHAR